MTPNRELEEYGPLHSRHQVKILMLRHLYENPNFPIRARSSNLDMGPNFNFLGADVIVKEQKAGD